VTASFKQRKAGEGTVKNLKLGVLAFGVLGLVSLLMEFEMLKMGLKHDAGSTIMVLAGFILPVVMGVLGLTKPPFLQWHAGVALAGFALVAVKFRIWQTIKLIGDAPMSFKLSLIACLGGIIVSAIALAKPEPK
jgi:hypothetical protein